MVRWMDEMMARVALLESIPGAGPVRTARLDGEESGEVSDEDGAARALDVDGGRR
jgi:hypothetical protein